MSDDNPLAGATVIVWVMAAALLAVIAGIAWLCFGAS